jgi:hypothetical protein
MWLASTRCSWVEEVAVAVVEPQEQAHEVWWVIPTMGTRTLEHVKVKVASTRVHHLLEITCIIRAR